MRSEPLMHICGKVTASRDGCYDRLERLLADMSEVFTVEEIHEILTARAKDYDTKDQTHEQE